MHVGHRFSLGQTLAWSKREVAIPLVWTTLAVCGFVFADLTWLAVPTLPMSLIGIAVAFYLGFKNNASYDRMWEARKIWGAIVNASRSWAFGTRDLVTDIHLEPARDVDPTELTKFRERMVLRHIAWMDALRFQLRKTKSWEHNSPYFDDLRKSMRVPEFHEDVREELSKNLSGEEVDEVLAQINPAARLLANQSRELANLRKHGLLDGFAHMKMQTLLDELMTQQGKAERIKNFPFPRQYATVNSIFAYLFTLVVPFAMIREFDGIGEHAVWLTVPFATIVCWVFLTTDKIGDWSENPFEGLANDVPISAMARGIERDMRQMLDQTELPQPRNPQNLISY